MANLDSAKHFVDLLRHCRSEQRRLKELEESVKEELNDLLSENEVGELDGKPVLEHRVSSQKKIDTRLLREQYPSIADLVTVERPIHSLRFLDEENNR